MHSIDRHAGMFNEKVSVGLVSSLITVHPPAEKHGAGVMSQLSSSAVGTHPALHGRSAFLPECLMAAPKGRLLLAVQLEVLAGLTLRYLTQKPKDLQTHGGLQLTPRACLRRKESASGSRKKERLTGAREGYVIASGHICIHYVERSQRAWY